MLICSLLLLFQSQEDPVALVDQRFTAADWVTILGAAGLFAAALAGAVVLIIKELRAGRHETIATKTLVIAGQEAGFARGIVRDKKVQEIHLLVNSRLLTVLRLLVAVTKKEAARTNTPDDIASYQEALAELTRAESANKVVGVIQVQDIEAEEQAAVAAESKLSDLRASGRDATATKH